jgi:hypothetical protein
MASMYSAREHLLSPKLDWILLNDVRPLIAMLQCDIEKNVSKPLVPGSHPEVIYVLHVEQH